MSLHPYSDALRWTTFVLAAMIGLLTAPPAPAQAAANKGQGQCVMAVTGVASVPCSLSVVAAPALPLANWQLFVINRSRMIQMAVIFLAIGIFILTRGRWR
jgi:hypothetical protein